MADAEKYPTISVRVNFPRCEKDQDTVRFVTTVDGLVMKHLPLFCKAILAVNKEIEAMKGRTSS
jgi:hypothetical protein